MKKRWAGILVTVVVVHVYALMQTTFPLYNSNMLFYYGFWILLPFILFGFLMFSVIHDLYVLNDIITLICKVMIGAIVYLVCSWLYIYRFYPDHCACSREEFYQKTQDYTEALCEKMARPDTEYLVLDQCVSTTNVKRYLNYIRDLKVIIVDRDPRDVYIQAMRDGDHVLPHDPLLFAKQYRDMRRTIDDEIKDPRILRIHFEDLIYRYDFTTKQINEFLGISEEKHKDLRKHFNPDISIRNTQLWINDKNYNNQIKIIEQELEDFLYLFPNREDDRQ